jgi:hypothetical protein
MSLTPNSTAFGRNRSSIAGFTFISSQVQTPANRLDLTKSMLRAAKSEARLMEEKGQRYQTRFISIGENRFGIAVIAEKALARVEALIEKLKLKANPEKTEEKLYKNASNKIIVTC